MQYVLEKFGVIWTLKNGVRQPEPFIDLASLVMEDGNRERGLLGLAFPPDAAWTVASGEQGGPSQAQTHVLIANTSSFKGTARVTVLREGARR